MKVQTQNMTSGNAAKLIFFFALCGLWLSDFCVAVRYHCTQLGNDGTGAVSAAV